MCSGTANGAGRGGWLVLVGEFEGVGLVVGGGCAVLVILCRGGGRGSLLGLNGFLVERSDGRGSV